jgi:hypothetical protein
MLETKGLDHAIELTRVKRYTQKKTIQHDLEAQKAALKMLHGAMEIISEFNIKTKEKKPDVLAFLWDDALQKPVTVAVEMEKSGKNSDGRYWMFKKYRELIEQREFDKVRFFFSNEQNMRDYISSFEKEEWPATVQKEIRTKKGTKTVPASSFVHVKKSDPIRTRFSFEFLNPAEPPAIFPLKEAAKLARILQSPYLERHREDELAPLRDAARQEEKARDEKAARLLAQQAEQQKAREVALESLRIAEQKRVKERDEKIEWYRAELVKAQAEDNSAKAWLPGYKFRHSALLAEYCEYLQEQLAIESTKRHA